MDIDSLWDYSDPEATALRFRELLPAAEASGDRSYHAQLLTQLARTQSLQRKFGEAHRLLDAARAIMDGPVAEIRYLLERGRTFNSAGEGDQAIPLFEEAYKKSVAHGEDFYAIDAAHMLGIVADQLYWNIKAMDLAEKTTDARARKWLGALYNNIGWSYHGQQDYASALTFFEKLLALRMDQQDERGALIARWSIGRTYRSLQRIDEALALQEELYVERQQAGLPPSGYVFEELAECLLLKDRAVEAKEYFRKAYEILSGDVWLVAEEEARIQRLRNLGE